MKSFHFPFANRQNNECRILGSFFVLAQKFVWLLDFRVRVCIHAKRFGQGVAIGASNVGGKCRI